MELTTQTRSAVAASSLDVEADLCFSAVDEPFEVFLGSLSLETVDAYEFSGKLDSFGFEGCRCAASFVSGMAETELTTELRTLGDVAVCF